jgi:molecular chaperone GrpE (heat shock protein)
MPYISQSSRYSSTSQLDRNILKAAASEIAKLRNQIKKKDTAYTSLKNELENLKVSKTQFKEAM